MLNWTPWALPGLAVFLLGLALAWFIYRARPGRHQNRILALQIVCEAVAVGLIAGANWVFTSASVVEILGLLSMFVVWPKLWTYYSFLATLDTPLARPLRRPGVLTGLLVITLIAATSVFLRPQWYSGGAHYWPAVDAVHMVPGSAFIPIFWLWACMWIVGLVFSISALRQARTPIRREQARAYLIAFGFRDVGFLLLAVMFTVVPPTWPHFHWAFLLFPLVWLSYYPLVAWGILQHQLFDIELRLKRGLERSVVAGAIAGAFFIGAYALEELVIGNSFLLGLVGAALVTAAIRPLHGLAQRLADRVMPGVDTSEAYLTDRRHEVYRDAVEGALEDGSISERERAILLRLQQSLGLGPTECSAIERAADTALSSIPGGAAALASI